MKKTRNLILLLLTFCNLLLAQQRPSGIKILVKDKETGFTFMNDSMAVIFNDSIKQQFVSDKDGYAFFALLPGRYTVHVGHVGYQSQWITGIVVAEAKTSYLTFMLSNGEREKSKKKKGGVKLKMVKN
jgi:hypothetical protein